MARALTTNGQQVYANEYPAGLFDSYLALAGQTRPIAMAAIRTRSLAARGILAHAATRDLSLDQLMVAARDGAAGRLASGSVNGSALAHLARTVALQEILPEDRADGVALYELALRLFGPDKISRYHQGLHAQLVFHSGDRDRTATLLNAYRRMSDEVRAYLELDLLNPFAGAGAQHDHAGWLARLARLLPEPAPDLTADQDAPPFDRLTCADRKAGGDERISVVVTAFKPGPGLATAVRSVLAQSWPDLEILIVDDGSPPDYDPVLKACVQLDDRVKLVKQPVNAGTYAARNAGLDAASGPFVTFQDSDDWSHPRRLADQVEPLLHDPSIVATVSDGLRVTDQLIVTHTPGRDPYAVVPSSLMLRKDTVLRRVGYFDGVRREADSEYMRRIQAAFGAEALDRLRVVYSLIRYTPDSLSRTDIRAGWMHPGRLAYKSAYHRWHQQIVNGEVSPNVPRNAATRPFVAPAYIRGEAAVSGDRPDVVFAGDWRLPGGVHRSMVDEIEALTRRGVRVGVLQIASFRHLPEQHAPLGRPVQQLINTGRVAQVFAADELDTDLVFVASPSVLQFPSTEPCRITAKRVVIRAGRAPAGPDGEHFYYTPRDCQAVAKQTFSADPLWSAQSPAIRAHIEAELPPAALLPDLPGIVDVARLRVDRTSVRSHLPVIGTHFTDSRTALPADRDTLLQIYPDSLEADVRFMGRTRTLPADLQPDRVPVNWLVYDFDEVDVRSFLGQIDFYVHFPPPSAAEVFSRQVLEALASGCVVIAPHRMSAAFDGAALYRDPTQVWETVRDLHSDRETYQEHSRRAQEWIRQNFNEDAYVSLVNQLIG